MNRNQTLSPFRSLKHAMKASVRAEGRSVRAERRKVKAERRQVAAYVAHVMSEFPVNAPDADWLRCLRRDVGDMALNLILPPRGSRSLSDRGEAQLLALLAVLAPVRA